MRALHFLQTLGAGSFGTVYLAEFSSEQGFRRNVAVKVLLANQADNEMFLSRIRDEARLLGLLQDDAILKVLDMVRIERLDAVVMEYVEGVDLESIVEAKLTPPPRALAELGAAVAGALGRAHQARHPRDGAPLNVIHRDVKPANIMLTRSGGVKLLDFGVARARFDARESYTGQLVLGTLNYMAPEYIVTAEVSPAADVYGLALSLWESASGRPFGQPKVRQNAHEQRVAENLAEIRQSHGVLADVLQRMLRWDPHQRPDAPQAERLLLEAADKLPGASLRSWATAVVPQVLGARAAAPDTAGLLGRTFPISGGSDSISDIPPANVQKNPGQDKISTIPLPEPGTKSAPLDTIASSTGQQPPPAGLPAAPANPPPPASPPASADSSSMDVLVVIIKGLLLGGSVGFVAVVLLAAYLLFRS